MCHARELERRRQQEDLRQMVMSSDLHCSAITHGMEDGRGRQLTDELGRGVWGDVKSPGKRDEAGGEGQDGEGWRGMGQS